MSNRTNEQVYEDWKRYMEQRKKNRDPSYEEEKESPLSYS